jgi:hypothetical protein
MKKDKSPGQHFVTLLLGIVRVVEIENEALRQMLKENGVQDAELRAGLERKTADLEVQKRVDSTIAPIVEGMPRLLGEAEVQEALAQWKLKGRPN